MPLVACVRYGAALAPFSAACTAGAGSFAGLTPFSLGGLAVGDVLVERCDLFIDQRELLLHMVSRRLLLKASFIQRQLQRHPLRPLLLLFLY